MKERRRGAELEAAILDAAWLELIERGYAALTMEAVAERCGTSRPVLARRWQGKAPLVLAAIGRQMARHPLDVPDRGALRAELLEFLDQASARAAAIAAAFSLFFGEYFCEGAAPKDFRAAITEGETDSLAAVFERAVQRGEADPAKLVPPVRSLLKDLFRHHVIMNFAAPPVSLRTEWVDAVFLPLVRPG